METIAQKVARILVCSAGILLPGVWFIGEIVGAVYWAAAGHIWASVGSLFIPLFGAISMLNAIIAS
jgi:hypothetical protein